MRGKYSDCRDSLSFIEITQKIINLRLFRLINFFKQLIIKNKNIRYKNQVTMIYEVQQTESECPECSRHNKNRSSSSSRSSSNSDQQQHHHNHHRNNNHEETQSHHRIVIPIHKNVIAGNKQIQRTLTILQEEVRKLKVDNQKKQAKIRKLEKQLNRKDIRVPVSSDRKVRIGSIYENQLRTAKSKSRRKFTPRNFHNRQSEYYSIYPPDHQSPTLHQIDEIQQKITQITSTKNDRIFALQKQLQKIDEYCKELQQKIDSQIKDNEWLTKFCVNFVQMVEHVSKMQGKTVVDQRESLRTNVKIGWKFMKEFVKQVIS